MVKGSAEYNKCWWLYPLLPLKLMGKGEYAMQIVRFVNIQNRIASINRNVQSSQSRVNNSSNSNIGLMGFRNILSRAISSRSDEEIKEAIRLQAQYDAAVGIFQGDALHKLREEFISPVSPDRRGTINSQLAFLSANWNGGASNVQIFHPTANPSAGGHIASFIPGHGWIPTMTREEGIRQSEILRVYADAWNSARFGIDINRADDNRPLNANSIIDTKA